MRSHQPTRSEACDDLCRRHSFLTQTRRLRSPSRRVYPDTASVRREVRQTVIWDVLNHEHPEFPEVYLACQKPGQATPSLLIRRANLIR